MLHDIKATPISPSKGKARERTHWEIGWWDFHPLTERLQKPFEWSQSSVLFTPHPTQPFVSGRHFSSSKQFRIPSPPPIVSSATSYEPPSFISVAPDDEWLFTYFPGRDCDGIGCLWKCGAQIDKWTVKEWWSFVPGAGVVTASWLGQARVWTTSRLGTPTRLPPRGPRTPISNPTLLLVTQNHRINLCYFRQHGTIFKIITCSLLQPESSSERQSQPVEDNDINVKRCIRAAIGLHYNEASIIVATRTSFLPPPSSDMEPQFNSTQVNFSIDLPQKRSLEDKSMEWEGWCEESTINLCEVRVGFDGVQMNLITSPLAPILHPNVGLVALDFVPVPASRAISSTTTSPDRSRNEKGLLYLAATHLDFGSYSSTPLSTLTVHAISRQTQMIVKGTSKNTWTYDKIATREFSPAVLTFITSSPTLVDSGPMVYAGIVNASGPLPTPATSSREVSIGTIQVLNLFDLQTNQDWETLPILSKLEDAGQDIPLNAVVSPNDTLVCTMTSSSWPLKTSLHPLPKHKSDITGTPISPLTPYLATAILSRRAATDITHILSASSTPITEAIDTLYQTIRVLDDYYNESSQSSLWGVLGEALVIYRNRAAQSPEEYNRNLLTDCWTFAHDMRSLAAYNQAFESCRKDDKYDLDVVWELIGLSNWLVSFAERLMKQCILACDASEPSEHSKPMTKLESPILLHLSHPLAISNLVSSLVQMNQFRGYLGSLSARGENAQIARDILVDTVDNSGIDFVALVQILSEIAKDCQALDRDDCRKGLASCRPTPAMHTHLVKVLGKLVHSNILNKPTLFVKPFDLVDSVGRLSVGPRKLHDRDIISKRILTRTPNVVCLYCAGRSDMGTDSGREGKHPSRWYVWENLWALRCICGGPWASNTDTPQM